MLTAQAPNFATILKQYRVAAGLTQEQLAERAGVSVRGISDLERGINRRPQRDTLAQLIDALHLGKDERTALAAAAGRGRENRDNDAIIDENHLPLVGRSRELAMLSGHLGEGVPPVLALAGEPGIGKTRLLQEAWVQGRERGFAVLYGGCKERSHIRPWSTRWPARFVRFPLMPCRRSSRAAHGWCAFCPNLKL